MKKTMGLMAIVGTMASISMAAEPEAAKSIFRFGFDERIRQEVLDDIPLTTGGILGGGERNYYRFRSRLWSEADLMDGITFRARAVNEVRYWNDPDTSTWTQNKSAEWPDELVFDNLSLDVKDSAGKTLDLRLGRQDLLYGNGRVICDGTPGDGSRTAYFDGLKASFKGIEKVTIDGLAFRVESDDPIAIDSADRNLIGMPSTENDTTESGAGIYVTGKNIENLVWEGYALYKNEEDWNEAAKVNEDGSVKAPTYSWEVLDSSGATPIYHSPELDLGTIGGRLAPQFSKQLKGNLEVAGQIGERNSQDVSGYMVDAGLGWTLPVAEAQKPTLEAMVYTLSGDDPATADDEGWNPLWSRAAPPYEIFSLNFPGYRWSNLIMPCLRLSVVDPVTFVSKFYVYAAYAEAMEDNGPGTGTTYGMVYGTKADLLFGQNLLIDKDKLGGHLFAEIIEPDDYYSVDEQAYLLRWEMTYAF